MLVEHIDADLELGLAEDPTPVPRTLIAGQQINGDCDAPSMSVAGGGGNGGAAIFIALWLLLSRGARRRRR
jgi:hypothetical protein